MPKFECVVMFRLIIEAEDVSIARRVFEDEVHDAERHWLETTVIRRYLGTEDADIVVEDDG